jgi:hypothetical protein
METNLRVRGNRCFAARGVCSECQVRRAAPRKPENAALETNLAEAPSKAAKRPQRVNLRFNKIRVQVTNAQAVQVREDNDSMTIVMD